MRKVLLLSLVMCLALVSQAWAQNRAISGKVTDQSTGEGLPGVAVLVKGTTIGTATNVDGSYTINVPATGNTLVFRFIGYVTVERPIGNAAVVDVNLATDAKQLQEVVVTAFGIEREKRALGYAVTDISGDKVTQRSEADPIRALQGKVAGVNIVGSSGAPGSSTRVTIRGNSSLLGNNQPLIVVDGIPFNSDQTNSESQLVRGSSYSNRSIDLDPNNIASYNVLKGAAAAALYGSRAANGVIVITTKSGSAQASKKGLEVSYNTSYAFEKVANLPDYQNSYGSGSNFAYSAANGSWGPKFGWGPEYSTARQTIPHPLSGTAALREAFPEFATATVPYEAYPNNVKDFFNTGNLFENSISVSGGSEKASLTTVISRSSNEGMIPNTKFVRTNISVGGSAKLDNKLIVGGNLSYINSNQQGPQLGANNAIGNAGAFSRTLFLPRNLDLTGLPTTNPLTRGSAFGWLTGQADNPYWSVENNGYTSNVDRIVASVNGSYDVLDWLNVSYTLGTNTYNDRRRSTVRPGSVGFGGTGNVLEDFIGYQEVESNLLVTLNKDLNEDISLKAIVGNNVNQRKTTTSSFSGNNIIVFGIDEINNTTQVVANGASLSKRRLYGVFSEVQGSYKDYLYLNVTGRNDWSSTLPVANRSFFYPSVSSSLVFTEALNMNSSILNYGKVRAGWSKVGNDASPYLLNPVYIINPSFGNNTGATTFPVAGTPGARLSTTIANPNLTPEFTTEIEFGADLHFLDGKIKTDVTWYDKRTTDQIASVTVPSATGFSSQTTNFGEISNRGIEVGLDITPLETNGFKWNTYTAFTRNRNKIEKLVEGVDQVTIAANFGGVQAVHRVGEAYGILYGSAPAKDEKGNILINPATGQVITALNPEVIGNPNPDFTVGFTNTFTYKGITLGAVMDYRHGGDIYSTSLSNLLGRGVTTDTEDREKTVIVSGVYGDPITRTALKNGDGESIPNSTAISLGDYWFGGAAGIGGAEKTNVFDGTVIRLREISLGYELPSALLEKTPFGSAAISFSGRNLWWFAPNVPQGTNYDPETSTYGSGNAQGFDFTNAPTARRYGVNLKVTF